MRAPTSSPLPHEPAQNPPPCATRPPTPERLRAWIEHLSLGLLQRDAAVRLALLAALAGEHVLLIGPPGTAKSALARRLHRALADARYFERLLTRFSTPEELFGPLSLKALEDDRYERLVDGFLPTAGIAFLDEVFKANSAILNALLTLLNEREFDNGTQRLRAPLVSLIGASNEGPADEALQAFFDRFLLRVVVAPVDDEAFDKLLQGDDLAVQAELDAPRPISESERQALTGAARRVSLSEPALAACRQLRAWLAGRGWVVSDRRWRQWVGLMRLAAASEGRSQVDVLDLWLAPQVVAGQPEQAQQVAQWFIADLLQAQPQEAPWLTRAVEAFERQLDIEQSQRDDADADNSAGKLALARSIGLQGADPGDAAGDVAGDDRPEGRPAGSSSGSSSGSPAMPRLQSARLEAALQRRFSPVHIAARVAQVDEVLQQAQAAQARVAAQVVGLAQALAGRLWLPPALTGQIQAGPSHTLAVLARLLGRLQVTRDGFAALPVDSQQPSVTPAPVLLEPQAA